MVRGMGTSWGSCRSLISRDLNATRPEAALSALLPLGVLREPEAAAGSLVPQRIGEDVERNRILGPTNEPSFLKKFFPK